AVAKKPFDVVIEADDDAGKVRMIVKKVESSDVVIAWDGRSLAEALKAKAALKDSAALVSVKSTLKEWNTLNNGYLDQIGKEKEKVKAAKEEIKEMVVIVPMIKS